MASIRRCFKIPKVVKNLFLGILIFWVFDVVLAGFGTYFLRGRVSFFSAKSAKTVLSDLLFLEGATLFGLITFVAYAIFGKRHPGDEYDAEGKRRATADEDPTQKRIPIWMFIVIIGASLMGLSIVIGFLPV